MLKHNSKNKILIKKILCFPWLNKCLQFLLKPVICLLPKAFCRIPVIGIVNTAVGNTSFLMYGCGNDTIATAIFWRGLEGFESETTDLFCELLDKSKVFIDVGANTGIYSLIAAAKKNDVYAFEPVPSIYESLQKNIKLNGYSNIEHFPHAIADRCEPLQLYIPASTAIPTSSSLISGFKADCESICVDSYTLDSFVEKNKIKTLDILKIDAEGAEIQVLYGAKRTILHFHPIIICEILTGHEKLPQKFFNDINYLAFLITSEGLIQQHTIRANNKYLNYLFVHEKDEYLELSPAFNTTRLEIASRIESDTNAIQLS
ncbi:FkbM family methyltransferase [Candidatus Uabimicrobium sp. HlEnr_7]|uniref:FkbM family methyltransferase n=1 Tax=Candidatus Uabimicrobium helgolandensis TaxID=3095367 RepID=UPI003556EBD8